MKKVYFICEDYFEHGAWGSNPQFVLADGCKVSLDDELMAKQIAKKLYLESKGTKKYKVLEAVGIYQTD